MVTLAPPARNAASARNDWHRELSADRPVYGCPECKEMAMQFFQRLADHPGREEFFRCCACGLCWEL